MQVPDIINGIFELGGSPLILLSIFKLLKDKRVKGVSKYHVGFFTSWGLWNLFYYPHLDQWASFIGGLFIVITNTIWLSLMLYYIKKEKNENSLS